MEGNGNSQGRDGTSCNFVRRPIRKPPETGHVPLQLLDIHVVNCCPMTPKTNPATAPRGGAQCFSNRACGAMSWKVR